MMVFALTGLVLAQAAPPTLTFQSGEFTITLGSEKETISARVESPKPVKFGYNVRSTRIRFEEGQLVAQFGNLKRTSRLQDVPSSPRFFSREEIIDNSFRMETKDRTPLPAEIIGWEMIGTRLYVVPQWRNAAGEPWLALLASVDTAADSPKIDVHFRLDGHGTLAQGDNLFRTPTGELTLISQNDSGWGGTLINLAADTSEFVKVGDSKPTAMASPNGAALHFVEETTYGTRLAGVFMLADRSRTDLFETRDKVAFIDNSREMLRVDTPTKVILHNSESGLQLSLPKDIGIRMSKHGVLVWTPLAKPRSAAIYTVNSLRSTSKWSATPLPARPPAGSAKPPKPR